MRKDYPSPRRQGSHQAKEGFAMMLPFQLSFPRSRRLARRDMPSQKKLNGNYFHGVSYSASEGVLAEGFFNK